MSIRKIYILPLISLFTSLLLVSCENFSDSPYPAISFEKKVSLPGNGRSSAVGFAINGKGYVALGKTDTRSGFLKDLWEYDPTLNLWTEKDSFPGVARVKAVAAVVGSKAYVGLGFANVGVYQNTGYLKDFWMYDSATDKWKKMKDFPGTSTDACISFVYKNNIYIGSGFDGFSFRPDFWRYNPSDSTWTQLADFPGDWRSGAVACTNGDRVFFGTGYNTTNLSDWWEYFPASDSWSQLKSIPNGGRENAVSLSINNRFFVSTGRFFGGTQTVGHLISDILEYDANHNTWYNRGNLPIGRENAITFTIAGKTYIGFGENDQTVLNDFYSFNP